MSPTAASRQQPALPRETIVAVVQADDLRIAIEEHQFQLWYQPQVELASGKVIGIEALLRWQHPRRGLLVPSEFIAVAEHAGMTDAIVRWIFDEACRQIRAWHDIGLTTGAVAINLCGMQFKEGFKLDDFVAATLQKWQVRPECLEIALTESAMMEISRQSGDRLENLRRIGVRLSMFDFGKGYASLNDLVRYRFNRLTIARELVLDVLNDPRNAAVMRAAIRLAEGLGMESMAGGVANVEQAAFLTTAGCRHAQGDYFSRPLSPGQMTAVLRQSGEPAHGAIQAWTLSEAAETAEAEWVCEPRHAAMWQAVTHLSPSRAA
jgi:diguanylate cyclase